MRHSLPLALLLSGVLAACASSNQPVSKVISQQGNLKVHPGLLGMPVPSELQQQDGGMQVAGGAGGPGRGVGGAGMKMDEVGLRTQRSVYFDYNSAGLRAEFNPMLQAHGRYLANNPKARVRVEGNADERGPDEYNSRLGMKRAEAVKQALVAQGAPEKQVLLKTLGESRPKLKGHDEESWAENRRADIVYEREQ